MNTSALLLLIKALDLLVMGLTVAPNVVNMFQEIISDVQVMIREGRDPTPAEWASLDLLRDEVHRTIQEAHKS